MSHIPPPIYLIMSQLVHQTSNHATKTFPPQIVPCPTCKTHKTKLSRKKRTMKIARRNACNNMRIFTILQKTNPSFCADQSTCCYGIWNLSPNRAIHRHASFVMESKATRLDGCSIYIYTLYIHMYRIVGCLVLFPLRAAR